MPQELNKEISQAIELYGKPEQIHSSTAMTVDPDYGQTVNYSALVVWHGDY